MSGFTGVSPTFKVRRSASACAAFKISAACSPIWETLLKSASSACNKSSSRVMPAWRRYQGGFYRHARPALGDAAAAGNVVIISGGYGLAGACESIGSGPSLYIGTNDLGRHLPRKLDTGGLGTFATCAGTCARRLPRWPGHCCGTGHRTMPWRRL